MSGIIRNILEFFLVLAALFITVTFISRIVMRKFPVNKLFSAMESKGEITSNFISSVIGALTPFCVCTTIPVFTGMVQLGLRAGPAIAFLFSSPLLNISAVALIFFLFGWKFAVYFTTAILAAATLGGILVPKLHMEGGINIKEDKGLPGTGAGTLKEAAGFSMTLFRKLLLPLAFGAIIAGFVHNYIPVGLIERFNGIPLYLAIPLMAVIGFPLYSNILVLAPVCFSLADKGMNSAAVMTLMMSGAGISFPTAIVLSKILKPRLYVYYLGYTFIAYCVIGFGFILLR
ncbi:MAG: permease [Candidatus Omnitrophota bacterium]